MATNNNNDPKKERTRQEATVLQDFMITTQRRVEHLRSTFTSGGAKDALDLSDGEKKVLNEIHNSGMMEGIIAGVATFVFVRRFPRYLEKVVARRAAQRGGGGGTPPPSSSSGNNGGYVLDQPPGARVNSPFSNSSNGSGMPPPGSEETVRRGGILWRTLGLMIDTSLSFLVAAYTSFYMADTQKIAKSVKEIPLMEGRSAISDNFCSDLIQEYNRQWNLDPNDPQATKNTNNTNDQLFGVKSSSQKKPLAPFDRKDILKNPQLGMLQAYIEFIGNCKKRQAMEKRIRQERGMGPNERVAIPSPGVTSTEWSSDEDVSLFSDNNDFFSGEKDHTGTDEFSSDEANSFVSDQGDDDDANSRK